MAPPPRHFAPVHSAPLAPAACGASRAGQDSPRPSPGRILTVQRWLTINAGLGAASLVVCTVSLLFGATRVEMGAVIEALRD